MAAGLQQRLDHRVGAGGARPAKGDAAVVREGLLAGPRTVAHQRGVAACVATALDELRQLGGLADGHFRRKDAGHMQHIAGIDQESHARIMPFLKAHSRLHGRPVLVIMFDPAHRGRFTRRTQPKERSHHGDSNQGPSRRERRADAAPLQEVVREGRPDQGAEEAPVLREALREEASGGHPRGSSADGHHRDPRRPWRRCWRWRSWWRRWSKRRRPHGWRSQRRRSSVAPGLIRLLHDAHAQSD